MIVVKVGGSLYDHPALGPGLRNYFDALAPSPILIVPGGGAFADAVRTVDATHALGEAVAHRLALRAMNLAGEFLKTLILQGTAAPSQHLSVLDAVTFTEADPELPHSWAVTSDSIALRAALVPQAERLILLKSVTVPPGTSWGEAATRGWVDSHFPQLTKHAQFPIDAVNFRSWLDRFSRPA